MERNGWLTVAGGLSAMAAVVHLAVIFGGAGWYRFVGVGEPMARAVERGSLVPHLWATAIAGVLAVWAAYAWAGAGLIPRLPLMRPALVAITVVYLVRGLALPVLLSRGLGRSDAFWWWSSLIVLTIGATYALGTWQAWPSLSERV